MSTLKLCCFRKFSRRVEFLEMILILKLEMILISLIKLNLEMILISLIKLVFKELNLVLDFIVTLKIFIFALDFVRYEFVFQVKKIEKLKHLDIRSKLKRPKHRPYEKVCFCLLFFQMKCVLQHDSMIICLGKDG